MDRIPLICTPTPVHSLPRLGADLGIDLWIKRDDLTGLALGGNKGRKLEYLMPAARGHDVVVTCGAAQSNFIRQLGATCAMAGVRCEAVVMNLPYEDGAPLSQGLANSGGNVLLDELLGVKLHWIGDNTWDVLYEATEQLALTLQAQGRRIYRIPVGGSSPLGAFAFVKAGEELDSQAASFDWIVVASSSGSTQAGLAWHFRGSATRVLGVACDPEPNFAEDLSLLSAGLSDLIEGLPLNAQDFDLDLRHVGPGYGVPSEAGNAAIQKLARTEGIFLDPIYTGKAFAALIDLAESGAVSGRVLFWHTGGMPTLFVR